MMTKDDEFQNKSKGSASQGTEFQSDWTAEPAEIIQLQPEQIETARQAAIALQSAAPDATQLWSAYLMGLAKLGFSDWLQQRSPQFEMQPHPSGHGNGEGQGVSSSSDDIVTVNGFRIALVIASADLDETVAIPCSWVDSSDRSPHFYVLARVIEEQSQVEVHAVLRHRVLVENRAQVMAEPALSATAERSYDVPISWFRPEPDLILLYLRCSNPEAFSSVAVSSEQQAAIAASPKLSPSAQTPIASGQSSLQQLAVNTAKWLTDQLDEVAARLAWTLLPRPALQPVFRDSSNSVRAEDEQETVQRMMTELFRRGVTLPTQARGAYQDLQLEGSTVRLYAVIGAAEAAAAQTPDEWQLILILKAADLATLPEAARLWIYAQEQLLTKVSLDGETDYLFAEVFGEVGDRLQAVLGLGDRQLLRLAPFVFEPQQDLG